MTDFTGRERLLDLWTMAGMSTTFPGEEPDAHEDADGSLYYVRSEDGSVDVHASIYRSDDKLPSGKLHFQYSAKVIFDGEDGVTHDVYWAAKADGSDASNMIQPQKRTFLLDGDTLDIVGGSAQHKAQINIKWNRSKSFKDFNP